MRLAEYHELLATEPLTRNQLGAIHGEFARLGFRDRGARLAASAALLGLDGLDSTRCLVMGEAGYLLRALQGFRDRTELDAAVRESGAEDEREGLAPEPARLTLVEALLPLFAMLWQRGQGPAIIAEPGEIIPPDIRTTCGPPKGAGPF